MSDTRPAAAELSPPSPGSGGDASDAGLVSPAKAMRVLTALRRTLDELNHTTIDEATRRRLVELHRATLIELASTLSDTLIDELVRLQMAPLDGDATAAQIKVAQAQLLGWVKGLFASVGDVAGEPVLAGSHPAELPVPAPDDETEMG